MRSILPFIFLCCLMASCSKSNQEINAAAILDNSPAAMIPDNTPTPSAEDLALIATAVSKVSPELRENFERKCAEWKDACNNSDIRLSSNMQDYTKPEQFTELVAMGEPIIPLVIEKMAQGDFFMQLVYEGIYPDQKIADSNNIGQQRAADYVLTWTQNAKRQAK